MANEPDAMAVMTRWRRSVKSKERRIFRFEERVDLRLDAIQARSYAARIPLDEWSIRQGYYVDLNHYRYIDADWRPIRVGESWGGPDVSAFFKRSITIPPEFDGQRVVLRFYIGGDSLLSVDGVPYHGLDPFRNEVILSECAQGGQTLAIEVESYVNWHSGEAQYNVFHLAELATVDPDIHNAYWDFRAAFKVLALNDIDPGLKEFLEGHLWDALKDVPLHEPDPARFKTVLRAACERARTAVYNSDRFRGDGLLHLVGHSHLDLVFMWPYREFVRKVGRTHATMLRLMEQYPDFKFSQSQAKLYADMKHHYPALFEQVKQRIREKRWEPVGAFWVEPDCNLISGESFVRQILYGQRFWREEFGVQSHVCWQPDVFGLSWAMPQILARSGIDTIMTNKMFVWNDTNPWRKNTFWWEGPDGSRVLAVVPPGHFIGMVDPDHMTNHWRDFSDKHTVGESLYCYGWGDGGGGVDPEMIECALRYRDFPGLVPTQFSHAEEALASIGARAAEADLPVWRDELYLEAHRGVYTNKARLKQLNRQGEIELRQAEMLAAWRWFATGDGVYPADRLDEQWRRLLTAQFHDSLPGTHVSEVYPQLLADYDELLGSARTGALAALHAMIEAMPVGAAPGDLILFNPLLVDRTEAIRVPERLVGSGCAVLDADGQPLPQQAITLLDDEAEPARLIQPSRLPGLAISALRVGEVSRQVAAAPELHITKTSLENACLRVTFDPATGEISSVYDKEQAREVLCGAGNRFYLFDDQPGKYDAWDIIAQYTEHAIDISGGATLSIDERGPLRIALRLEKQVLASRITQRISLTAGSRLLTFETRIAWAERQKLLKVGFPVDVNARTATYDIAYGNMERPTHRNTSYDAARFEVAAHMWADVSEDDYGVALLNDCKYGHEVHGSLLRLTLLKGSIYPDPHADLGTHHFTYALYPHAGGWREAGVMHAARQFNMPPVMIGRADPSGTVPDGPAVRRLLHCDAPNITLEAVKRSEDGQHLIVRLVERYNRRTRCTLTLAQPVAAAWSCDLMETSEAPLPVEGSTVELTFKPYEIVTVRLALPGTA